MVRVTDIQVGVLHLSKTKKVDEQTFAEFSKRHTPKIGDIVFSRVGSYGVSSLVSSSEIFCLGQNTVFIIPKINSIFLYYFLNSGYAKKQFDELKDGVTQPTISLKSIKSVLVPLPSDKEINKLNIIFEELYNQSNMLRQIYLGKSNQLTIFKQSILKQAFSGELVKE
jgi:type I restriction enzyme S subunit